MAASEEFKQRALNSRQQAMARLVDRKVNTVQFWLNNILDPLLQQEMNIKACVDPGIELGRFTLDAYEILIGMDVEAVDCYFIVWHLGNYAAARKINAIRASEVQSTVVWLCGELLSREAAHRSLDFLNEAGPLN